MPHNRYSTRAVRVHYLRNFAIDITGETMRDKNFGATNSKARDTGIPSGHYYYTSYDPNARC